MKDRILRIIWLFLLAFNGGFAYSQAFYVGMSTGAVNYQGELQEFNFDRRFFRFIGGASAHYEWKRHLAFTAELSAGSLSGRDLGRNRHRNLHFDTRLIDFSVFGRINLYNSRDFPIIPYVAAGLTAFHVDPYTVDVTGAKTFLYPLRLEGQGMDQYPERKPQRRVNIAAPVTGGVEIRVTERLRVDFEVTLRKTFTDYLDDVSFNYPDPDLLRNFTGPKAVELSYRGDELPDGNPVFPTGAQRGNPGADDWYNVFTLRFRIPLVNWDLNRRYDHYLFRKKGWPYNW